jgi:hypothetical protein
VGAETETYIQQSCHHTGDICGHKGEMPVNVFHTEVRGPASKEGGYREIPKALQQLKRVMKGRGQNLPQGAKCASRMPHHEIPLIRDHGR